MRIDVTQELVGFDGGVIREKGDNGTSPIPMTLRSACCTALMATTPSEQNLGGDAKLQRYMLAQKLHNEESVAISIEELALIKKLVGEVFIINVVGAVWKLLEGDDEG